MEKGNAREARKIELKPLGFDIYETPERLAKLEDDNGNGRRGKGGAL